MICNSRDCSRPVNRFVKRRILGGCIRWLTHLSGILGEILPIFITKARLYLESFQVTQLSIVTESEYQEVVEFLCLWCPLALDDTSTGPGSLGQVMGVLLFLGTAVRIKTSTLSFSIAIDGNTDLRCSNDLATFKLQRGAARSAKNRSVVIVLWCGRNLKTRCEVDVGGDRRIR